MSKISTEPTLPDCLGPNSAAHTPTVGMRHAPELLVFELFRELGYGDSRNHTEKKAKEYSEVIDTLPEQEYLLLSACRGRQVGGSTRKTKHFYAPPYLGLSKYAWFRQSSDRVIRDYFLRGPLASQAAKGKLDKDKDTIVRALLGNHSAQFSDDPIDKEILSLLALTDRQEPTQKEVENYLTEAVSKIRSAPLADSGYRDPFACTLYKDFLVICRLEKKIARREWLYFLIAFLRIATAMFMLAHLRITIFMRDWLVEAALQKKILPAEYLVSKISKRHEGLLHPTSSPTREVFELIEKYMQARVELRLMVGEIEKMKPELFKSSTGKSKLLSLGKTGAEFITLSELLKVTRDCDWRNICGHNSLVQWLTREAEKYEAWRSPRTKGQGENIDEFIRVLYQTEGDDSGSSLLVRCKNSTVKIVPEHRLLQLFSMLASSTKSQKKAEDRGKLVLRDIEQHLYDYGIDFRSSSYGRPLLIDKLKEGGFLKGSPDAGESAEVLVSFKFARS